MRIIFLLLFLAGNLCVQAQQSLDPLPRTTLFGREYVKVTDWASLQKIQLHWTRKDNELRATNATSKIYFVMDSRFAMLNGINFILSYPVIYQKEKVYISVADLKATVHPILFPEKMPVGEKIKTICIDAGHGGKDPGKQDGNNQEKKFALLLAEEVENILKKSGLKVVQTRKRDYWVELPERAKIANESDADLFVSLHYNAAGNRNAQGTEVYCLTPAGASSSNGEVGNALAPTYRGSAQNGKNVSLAYQLQKSLVKSMNVQDRGVKRAQFVVLSATRMPSILVEAGFMTNPVEAKRIYNADYRKKMAFAIAEGILNYKNLVER